MKAYLVVMFGCWIVALLNAGVGNWRLFAITATSGVMLALIFIADTLRDIQNDRKCGRPHRDV